jgi:hypothetical protein
LHEFQRETIELPVVIIEKYHFYQLHTKFYPILSSKVEVKLDEIISNRSCGFRPNRSTIEQMLYIRQIVKIR